MGFGAPVKERDVNSINAQGCLLQTERARRGMRTGRVSVFEQLKRRFGTTMCREKSCYHEATEYKIKDKLD